MAEGKYETEIVSKLVGVTFNQRQKNISFDLEGRELFWLHEESNPRDKNAVMVYADQGLSIELGHINRRMAKPFVERMNNGVIQTILCTKITGGVGRKAKGVNVKVLLGK